MQREENDGAVYCRLTDNIQPRRIYELQRENTYRRSSSLKIRSQYDNCRVWLRNNYQKNIDMKARNIIYSSTIIVLGFIQTSPIFICLASTIILLNVLGILYGILLAYIWGSTKKGKWYFRELWRSTLRLENFILPGA